MALALCRRVLIAAAHILSAVCVYFVVVYQTIIDGGMVGNVLNTRTSEALPFFSWPLLLTVLFIGRQSQEKLVNAYDNTLVYTDRLLAALTDTLRTLPGWHTAVLFFSDHGESLGENGLYMHGAPMAVSPREQYEIPFLIWTSLGFRQLKALPAEIEQHAVYHSVLNLLGIESPVYNPDLDVFVK